MLLEPRGVRTFAQSSVWALPQDAGAAQRHVGCATKLTDDDIEAAKALLANPDIGVTQIAHPLGVSPVAGGLSHASSE